MKWLVYGGSGWIGSDFCKRVPDDVELVISENRADDPDSVAKELDEAKPDSVLMFIGRTSGPGFNSIDYLEQAGRLLDNVRDNLFSPVVVMKLTEERGVHCVYLGTGCIFSYDSPDDPAFTTESLPNFFGSSYSTVKGYTDRMSSLFTNVLNVRIRMPISSDHPRSFITKIVGYPKILNSLNSMTVLDDAIPVLIDCTKKKMTGTVNLVNPGPIDHVTILELYRQIVDPSHTYSLVDEEEHDSLLLSKRSKNLLEPSFDMPTAKDSIEKLFRNGFKH